MEKAKDRKKFFDRIKSVENDGRGMTYCTIPGFSTQDAFRLGMINKETYERCKNVDRINNNDMR